MAGIKYKRPVMTTYQTEIMDCTERFACIEASTKAGKTASMIVWLLEQALKCGRNQSVYWIAPVYSQSKIAFDRMKFQVSEKDFFKVNESRLTLALPHGSIIEFKSADTPDSLYGNDCYAAVLDEASRMKEESWFAIRSTITKTGGKCKLIGNVKGRKNFFYKMCQKAKSGQENYFYKKITAYDAVNAGILSMSEIEDAKQSLPEKVFQELYLAEASEDGTNPFGLQFIRQCVYPLSDLPAAAFGGDLAKSVDWTVEVGLDKFGTMCHFKRYQKDWRSTIASFVSLPPAPTKMDSTGVGDPIVEAVQAVRQNVTGFKFTQFSKQQIMEGLALAIQQRKITFPEGIIVDELEAFEYEYTRTGVRYTAPEGMTDDCVCALALAYDQLKSGGTGVISWA